MEQAMTARELSSIVQQLLEDRKSDPDINSHTHLSPRFIHCDVDPFQLELAYETKSWMANPMKVVHGGMVALLLDNVMGMLGWCLCSHSTPTISMTVNYPRPVPLDTTVHLRAKMVMLGRTSSQLAAELFLPDAPHRVLAYATGVYYTKPQP